MSTAAHTPGPWRVIEGRIIKQDFTGIGLSADAGVLIGSAAGYPSSGFFPGEAEGGANARLIAAAPTLLMALEFLLEQAESFNVAGTYFHQFRENRDALDTARDAIAKATGSAA